MSKAWTWVNTDVLPLTREIAEEIASLPHFEGDRPWDNSEGRRRMLWLSRLVDEQRFYPPRWATAEFEGVMYRVNGGTSSHMLINRNGQFPQGLQVLIDRFVCETLDGIADLFDQFDHRKSIRTMIQKVRAHKPAEPALAESSPTDISAAVTGIAASLCDFKRTEEDDKTPGNCSPSPISQSCPITKKGTATIAAITEGERAERPSTPEVESAPPETATMMRSPAAGEPSRRIELRKVA